MTRRRKQKRRKQMTYEEALRVTPEQARRMSLEEEDAWCRALGIEIDEGEEGEGTTVMFGLSGEALAYMRQLIEKREPG